MNLDAKEALRIARRLAQDYALDPSSLTSDIELYKIYVVGSRDPFAIVSGLHVLLIRFFFVGDMETFGELTSVIESSFGKEGVRAVTWTERLDGRQIVLSRIRIRCYVK